MKCPRLPHVLAIALTAACGGLHAQTSFNAAGEITPGTCQWSTGDADRTVALDPIFVDQLSPNSAAGFKSFSLTIDHCTEGMSNAIFIFSGTPDSQDPMRYRNTGGAVNVAIELESSDGRTIGANGINSSRTVPIVSQQATLDLKAGYWRVGTATVGAGTVASVATVTMQYN